MHFGLARKILTRWQYPRWAGLALPAADGRQLWGAKIGTTGVYRGSEADAGTVNLNDWRTKRKWSQTTLALRADVDRNYISLIELGRNSPSLRTIFRLCDALDIAPSELMKDIERRLRI